jgi:PHD/YefM family antitoxin component YafN of YafNO toxin-antitoxin module
MTDLIRIKRGTRAQLDAAAGTNALNEAEPYLITDEGRVAVGLNASTYAVMSVADTSLSDYGLVTDSVVSQIDYGAL